MTEKLTARESGLRTQRDAHQRRNTRLETQNRLLLKHQQDIRDWIGQALDDYQAARDTDAALKVANELMHRAAELLGDTKRLLPKAKR